MSDLMLIYASEQLTLSGPLVAQKIVIARCRWRPTTLELAGHAFDYTVLEIRGPGRAVITDCGRELLSSQSAGPGLLVVSARLVRS